MKYRDQELNNCTSKTEPDSINLIFIDSFYLALATYSRERTIVRSNEEAAPEFL